MSRIVVIDDEPVLRFTFRHILEEDGHQVWDAENGRIGIQLCREAQPDLVITDMVMPEQQGAETLRILRAEFPKTPVIAMSGMDATFEEEVRPEQQPVSYVMKPLDRAALLGLVRTVLSG